MTKITWNDPETSELLLKALKLQLCSCTCLTKTPEVQYHQENCKYRLAVEVYDGILALRNQLEVERRYSLTEDAK